MDTAEQRSNRVARASASLDNRKCQPCPVPVSPIIARGAMLDKKQAAFSGRLVIVGFGSIGQGVLPLLLRHLEIDPGQLVIVTAEPRGHEVAAEYGVRFIQTALTRENYRVVLDPRL